MAKSEKEKPAVLLGVITGAHGIRGEVTLRTFTAFPEDIAAYGPLAGRHGKPSFKIRITKVTPKGVIARIDGVADRNAAEALKGTELYAKRDKFPETNEGEFYYADLVGLEARDSCGKRIGEIVGVANYGAGDLLEFKRDGSRETDFIPFTDACVPEIDVGSGFAVILPPDMTGEPEPAMDSDNGEIDDSI